MGNCMMLFNWGISFRRLNIDDSRRRNFMKKADFFISKKGKVVVCFRTYTIADGATGSLNVTLPSRYNPF